MRIVYLLVFYFEMIELLILLFSWGVDVNFVGKDGNMLFFIVINEEMFKMVIDLIEWGVDVNYIGVNNLIIFECCYVVFKKFIKELYWFFCRY